MFYLVLFEYFPNTAATNRIMAYVKAISEMGIKSKVVFFIPDPYHSMVEEDYPCVEFEYLWEHYYINIPKLNKLSQMYYLRRFVKQLNEGDIVYIYDMPDLVCTLSKRQDIKVFHERTEHPDIHCRGKIKRVSKESYLKSCQEIDGVMVISKGLKQYFIDNGCKPERVHIINMIVDETRFKGVEKQQCEPYIAYCGTASNNKDGVDQLIKAFAIVSSIHPNYKLYIIGNVPSKSQRAGNYKLVEDLRIEKKVVFTGMIPSKDMPQMLKNAEILALDRPNNQQAKYGFPTKLGEYLITGNAVVVTCVGDIPLYLKDGVNALISEPQNPQAFADKLCWVIEHPEEARIIGAKGKALAKERFNYMIETKKIIDVIAQEYQ